VSFILNEYKQEYRNRVQQDNYNKLRDKANESKKVTFAVTPANDRLAVKSTARFKLHLEDPVHIEMDLRVSNLIVDGRPE
jgi:hypothetical protein